MTKNKKIINLVANTITLMMQQIIWNQCVEKKITDPITRYIHATGEVIIP